MSKAGFLTRRVRIGYWASPPSLARFLLQVSTNLDRLLDPGLDKISPLFSLNLPFRRFSRVSGGEM